MPQAVVFFFVQILCAAYCFKFPSSISVEAGQRFPGCVRLNGPVWFVLYENIKNYPTVTRSTSDPDLTGFCNPPRTGFCNDSFEQDVLTRFLISEK